MFYPVIDQEAYNLFDAPQLTGTPERRLLLAILERAILDFVGNDPVETAEAEDWIFGELEEGLSMEPFTFGWICQFLDLEAVEIAKTIRKMPRRGTNRVAPWYFMNRATSITKADNAKPASSSENNSISAKSGSTVIKTRSVNNSQVKKNLLVADFTPRTDEPLKRTSLN